MGGDGLIQAQHDQVGVDGCADGQCDEAGCIEECLDGVANHAAEFGADGSENDQGNGNDDEHGEQRL